MQVQFLLLKLLFQVPQFILDQMWGRGESCKVVCTQPRRISAISGTVHESSLFVILPD